MGLDVKEVGRRIRTEREARSLSVDAFAKQAALPEAFVEQLERGELDDARLDSLDALARALAVPLVTLLTDPQRTRTEAELAADKEREAASFWNGLPTSLRAFVEEERAGGRSVADDTLRSLAKIQFQEQPPGAPDGWRRVLEALMRSLHPT